MGTPIVLAWGSIANILEEVDAEYGRALNKFPPYNSAHEGYAVILEELDELWHEVKEKPTPHRGGREGKKGRMRAEALQVAVTAVRFIHEVCGDEIPPKDRAPDLYFPAQFQFHWPGSGPIPVCEAHLEKAKAAGRVMGFMITFTELETPQECVNCVNEAKTP